MYTGNGMLPAMSDVRAQRIGTALQQMAEDLVAERRRSMRLARENQALRAQLEELRAAELERLRRAAPGLVVSPPPLCDERVRSAAGSM